MSYRNNPNFTHSEKDRVGVLITNLGTPDAPTSTALRRYLKEFLSDPRVIEIPRIIWWMILNLVILQIRPPRSAKAYKSVWTEEGSPLAIHTENQAKAIAQKLKHTWGDNIVVEWAMRYGTPAIDNTLQKMQEQGVRKLIVLPLYPQYSGSTTGSTFDALAADFTQRRWIPELRFVTSYHDHPEYISALANSIQKHWQAHGKPDKLVFSYHGLPKRYLHNGDPYHCQCHKTTRLIVTALGLKAEDYLTTFQSRVGKEEWLRPYTDETLKSLPEKGVKHIQVICPGFSADCLETLEEIDEENREYFLQAGGEKYSYIPALNTEDEHIHALTSIINANLQGWRIPENTEIQMRQTLADAHELNQKK